MSGHPAGQLMKRCWCQQLSANYISSPRAEAKIGTSFESLNRSSFQREIVLYNASLLSKERGFEMTDIKSFVQRAVLHVKEMGHKVISFSISIDHDIFAKVRKDNGETEVWMFQDEETLEHEVLDIIGFGAVAADMFVLKEEE